MHSSDLPRPMFVRMQVCIVSFPWKRVFEEPYLKVFTMLQVLFNPGHSLKAFIIALHPSQKPIIIEDKEPLHVFVFPENLLEQLGHEEEVALEENKRGEA